MTKGLTLRLLLGLSLVLPVAAHSQQFSIAVIPDTQWYAELHPEVVESQIDWIVANQVAENIIYVAHLGDLKDDLSCDNKTITAGTGASRTEWQIVDQAFADLDGASIAYGVIPGNHDFDQVAAGCPNFTTERPLGTYNFLFGPARFGAAAWYGDPGVPTDGNRVMSSNEDNFALFDSNGVKFIAINFAYKQAPDAGPPEPELDWADALLKAYPDRLGIVTSHFLMDQNPGNNLGPYGQQIYDWLANNPNLFMMLSAHEFGEAWQTATTGRTGMEPVQILLTDYQQIDYPGDGDMGTPCEAPNVPGINFTNLGSSPCGDRDSGFMRIMRFDTGTGMVNIETFIPPEPVIKNRLLTVTSTYFPIDGTGMGPGTASNLSFSYLGYVGNSVLIDFDTQQDGTAYVGLGDSFPANEYDGVVINDSDPSPGFTNVNSVDPINVGTDISGYHVNVGAFAATPQTQVTVDFTTTVTNVSFDFASTDGNLTVTAFDAGAVSLGVIQETGTGPFVNQAGFQINAGQVNISGIGDIASLLIEPSLNHALIFDNLSFTTTSP